jgi:hypothetical protein
MVSAGRFRQPSVALCNCVEAARQGTVTLLFGAHDTERSNAVALRDYLVAKLRKEWADVLFAKTFVLTQHNKIQEDNLWRGLKA